MAQNPDGALRADAAENRERLLAAAREMFAEHGLEVSLRQIARHAGVSEPTLRRRFATREHLVAEAFEDQATVYAEAAEAALKDLDPWVGFTGLLRLMAQMQLRDRGFAEVLTMSFPVSTRYEQQRARAWKAVQAVITRAVEAGRLREDFVAEDIVLLLLAHAGVVAGAGPVSGQMSDRLLAYLLQAFAAPGMVSLPPAPSPGQTYRALLRLHS